MLTLARRSPDVSPCLFASKSSNTGPWLPAPAAGIAPADSPSVLRFLTSPGRRRRPLRLRTGSWRPLGAGHSVVTCSDSRPAVHSQDADSARHCWQRDSRTRDAFDRSRSDPAMAETARCRSAPAGRSAMMPTLERLAWPSCPSTRRAAAQATPATTMRGYSSWPAACRPIIQ
jgi:hypothetical protein